MKNLGITYKEVKDKNVSIMYFDWFDESDKKVIESKWPETMTRDQNAIPISGTSAPMIKELTLQKIEDVSNVEQILKKEIAEKLSEIKMIVHEGVKIGVVTSLDKLKLQSKIATASYYIATDGRIGMGNTLILNQNTYDKYVKDSIDEAYEISINEFIPDNELFVNRKIEIEEHPEGEPGYYILSHLDKETNELYASVVELGWSPHKQVFKIEICLYDIQT